MVLFHKSSCPLENLSFYPSIWSGIKPISIYGKNPAIRFKDSLPFPNRTRKVLGESRAGICLQPDRKNCPQMKDFPRHHEKNQF